MHIQGSQERRVVLQKFYIGGGLRGVGNGHSGGINRDYRLPEKKKNNVLKIPEITNILMAPESYSALMAVDWDRIHNQSNACS